MLHKILTSEDIKKLEVEIKILINTLKMFKQGVMLLDEVDLLLHPLKSELNFPLGEKFDSDGSEDGARWNLVTHIMDAIFLQPVAEYRTEYRGQAAQILQKLKGAVGNGLQQNALQRLPHLTLLDLDFYKYVLMPILAEWIILWLRQQHVAGLDHNEMLRYIIDGAAAKGDCVTKVKLFDLAISEREIKIGLIDEDPELTTAHLESLSLEDSVELNRVNSLKRSLSSDTISEEEHSILEREIKYLKVAKDIAEREKELVLEVCEDSERLREIVLATTIERQNMIKRIELCKAKIEKLENPRDSSLDNSTIVWMAPMFAANLENFDEKGDGVKEEQEIHRLCSKMEEQGFSLRQCSEDEEALEITNGLIVNHRLMFSHWIWP